MVKEILLVSYFLVEELYVDVLIDAEIVFVAD